MFIIFPAFRALLDCLDLIKFPSKKKKKMKIFKTLRFNDFITVKILCVYGLPV